MAVVASVLASSQRAAAVRQRDQAIYNQVVAKALQLDTSDTQLAAQLTLAAYRIQPTEDLASRLLNIENAPLPSSAAAGAGFNSVAFSRDGRTLASGAFDNTIRLWDIADPARPRPLGQPMNGGSIAAGFGAGVIGVLAVAFSPDGHTLASGSLDATVRLWDVADPARARLLSQSGLPGRPDQILAPDSLSLAFSPDGHTLARGNDDGSIRLWDVADPAHPSPLGPSLTTGTVPVQSVAFRPGGHTLASGSLDGTVRLWDVADPAHPSPLGPSLTTGTVPVQSVAFSPGGHTLASGDHDGTVRLWDVADPAHPRLIVPILTGGGVVKSVAFSPGGHTLASGSLDGTIRLWSLPRTVMTGVSGAVKSVAFSPGGHTLASGNSDDTVRLWDVADPTHPSPLGPILTGGGVVNSVALSPGGHTLASGSDDGTVRLRDVADPAHPRLIGPIIVASGFGAVHVVVFSPGGHMLARGDHEGTVRLWDVTDPAHPGQLGLVPTGGNAVDSVAFSPGGHTLASGGDDGTTRLWNLNVGTAIDRICATAGGLTPRQWNQYIPQLPYQPSCVQ